MQPEGSIIELCHVTRDLDAALLHWTRDLGAGPFFVFEVPVLPGDTPDVLAARVLTEEHRIYPQALALLSHHILAETP